MFAFGSKNTNPRVEVDLDLAKNSGVFDDAHVGGVPSGWTNTSTGTGTLTQDLAIKEAGASSLRLNSGTAGQGVCERIFLCSAGETLTIRLAARGDNTNPCLVSVQDLESGQWIGSGGAWQNAATNWVSRIPNSFLESKIVIPVSAMSLCASAVRRIRVRFRSASLINGAQAWVDGFYVTPGYDTLVVAGHNVRQAFTIDWQHASDAAYATAAYNVAAFTPVRDKFYAKLPTVQTDRFVRVFVGLTTDFLAIPDNIYFGEMIVGTSFVSRCPVSPIATRHTDHRSDVPLLLGGVASRGMSRSARRTKTLSFQFPDTPTTAESGEWSQWFDEIFLRQLGGIPLALVPTTDRQEVLFGTMASALSETDGEPGQAGYKALESFAFEELPLPVELP